jgi:8-oxo-dGTP pyrophosphatase MutT (NUDIX family)
MEGKVRLAATALIYKDGVFESDLLGVSRKDNSELFGLPGGKVDPGEDTYTAMVREVFEETGLFVDRAVPLFFREEEGFLAVVYLVTEWYGDVSTSETGKVDWIDFEVLKRGSFAEYNAKLEEHITSLGLVYDRRRFYKQGKN